MTGSADNTPPQNLKRRRLVVLVPGFRGSVRTWQLLIERLSAESEFATADTLWFPYEHGISLFSLRSLNSEARNLAALINGQWHKKNGFDDIILVGHSMGGLIVRQCYLLGVGASAENQPAPWASVVRRVVLMASLNRGLDWESRISFRIWAYLARIVTPISRLATSQVMRGSDFLTNLRIEWIRHFSNQDAQVAPLIVQLLGTMDSEVTEDDSKDVLAFPSGHYISVPDANHRGLPRLDLAKDPDIQYALVREAFLGELQPQETIAKNTVRRVVFVLHGIRDSNVANWVDQLRTRIEVREADAVEVVTPTYGYFTAARFALPTVRRKNIRIFQDWYTEALARHPQAQFDVIAHSNGTYILGHSLLRTPGMRFTNVALVGSVLPQDFWYRFDSSRAAQTTRVRNDRANRDWPVALLCNALAGLNMRDVGIAGFGGFLGDVTEEVAYYSGGHSAGLQSNRLDSLVDFTLDGPFSKPSNLAHAPGYFQQLSNAMPLLAQVVVAGAILGLLYAVFQNWTFHFDRAMTATLALIVTYWFLDIV